MSFIKEITPFIERIELHLKGHGRFSRREELLKVRDIHFEYIRKKDFDTPTDVNCSSCLSHMMNQLIGEIGRQSKGEKMSFPKVEDKFINYGSDSDYPKELLKSIEEIPKKWGAFKKYCTSKGINTKKKTKKQLEEELNNL